ncbi:MAG: MBL fold metallo-hydrolase [Zhaonellaceae bacterium]|jgi:hydroxyacylglutathione hydrolase|nr:MBL fold metallo-hydrolase [Clostridia bacterium]
MIFKSIKVGRLATNCYILGCSETLEGAVVDPGDEADYILTIIEEENLKIKYIINTHGHSDHIGANKEVKKSTGAQILIHGADEKFLLEPKQNLSNYSQEPIIGPAADQLLSEGYLIKIGNSINLNVIHTPGHTPGSICLLGENFILTGDTLFAGSIGRTDLPGGSYDLIIRSIKEKLLPLPNNLLVYPGHGPSSTLQKEKETNSFLS